MNAQAIQHVSSAIGMEDLQQRLGRTDPTILELGSHDGTDTLRFLNAFPRCVVHCFECDPRPIKRFNNRLSTECTSGRVVFNQVAIADRCGEHEFLQSGGQPSSSNSIESWDYSSSLFKPTGHLQAFPWCTFETQIKVRTTTLDQWLADNNERLPQFIDLVWADLQGSEHLMIKGGTNVLSRTRYLYCEFYNEPMYEGQVPLFQLLDLLGCDWELLALYEGHNFLAINHSATDSTRIPLRGD